MPIDARQIPDSVRRSTPLSPGGTAEGALALGVPVGETLEFSKTIGESDIDLFAGATGAKIEAMNQHGGLVMVAEHIMKCVEKHG